MAISDDIIYAIRKLLPDGMAFQLADNGIAMQVLTALVAGDGGPGTITGAYNTIANVLDALIPDNPGFTIDDAHDWYRRLGIYDPGTLTLSQMIPVILQKMSWPGAANNQQTAAYIQAQLIASGFTSAKVFKNNFGAGGEAISAGWWTGDPIEVAMCGLIECNDTQCGTPLQPATGTTLRKVANFMEEGIDDFVCLYPDYRSTFFIAAAMSGTPPSITFTPLSVSVSQKPILRQLILQLKAQQLVCWLYADYT
jgi:hypothetical protein